MMCNSLLRMNSFDLNLQDLRGVVLQICEFLGKRVSDDVIECVVEKSSFDYMRKDPTANYESLPDDVVDSGKGAFLRKGTKGRTRVRLRFSLTHRLGHLTHHNWDVDS